MGKLQRRDIERNEAQVELNDCISLSHLHASALLQAN